MCHFQWSIFQCSLIIIFIIKSVSLPTEDKPQTVLFCAATSILLMLYLHSAVHISFSGSLSRCLWSSSSSAQFAAMLRPLGCLLGNTGIASSMSVPKSNPVFCLILSCSTTIQLLLMISVSVNQNRTNGGEARQRRVAGTGLRSSIRRSVRPSADVMAVRRLRSAHANAAAVAAAGRS